MSSLAVLSSVLETDEFTSAVDVAVPSVDAVRASVPVCLVVDRFIDYFGFQSRLSCFECLFDAA